MPKTINTAGLVPSWLRVEKAEVRDGFLYLEVKCRKWHPGFWWAVLRLFVSNLRA